MTEAKLQALIKVILQCYPGFPEVGVLHVQQWHLIRKTLKQGQEKGLKVRQWFG